jgi:hypothetical protein
MIATLTSARSSGRRGAGRGRARRGPAGTCRRRCRAPGPPHTEAMRGPLKALLAVSTAAVLVAAITIGSLIGLNAECNGPVDECPRSDSYVGTRLALPPIALVLVIVGAVWSVRRRTVRPLVLAEAAVLAIVAIVGAASGGAGIGAFVLLVVAAAVGRAAWRTL